MSQYLLSTYAVEGEVPGAPRTPEEMQPFMERVAALGAVIALAFLTGGLQADAQTANGNKHRRFPWK